MKTLLGVLSAMIDLPLAVELAVQQAVPQQVLGGAVSSPSSFIERSDHFWSKCTET